MAQVQKSKLMQKVGNVSKVISNRVEKGVEAGFPDLPVGVKGIAQVKTVRFAEVAAGKKNAGEYYFYADGIVTEPQHFQDNGSLVKVRGQRTNVMINCYGANKDKNIDRITNILLAVGGPDLLTPDCDLEQVAKSIQNRLNNQSAPPVYIRFRTWLGKATPEFPNPRVQSQWDGDESLSNYKPPSPTDAQGAPAAQDETGSSESFDETKGDLDSLIAQANADNGDAQATLREQAKKLGATDEELDDEEQYPTWDSIGNFIRAGGIGLDSKVVWEPKKGDKCKYKGKSYAIEAIQGRSKTAHLKGYADSKKKPVAVKLEDLEEA